MVFVFNKDILFLVPENSKQNVWRPPIPALDTHLPLISTPSATNPQALANLLSIIRNNGKFLFDSDSSAGHS